jgi:hypothetical protein
MTTFAAGSAPHLNPAELAQLLDGEHAPAERARWDAHIAGCARCSRRIDGLRADAGVVREWLERAAFEEALPHGVPALHTPQEAGDVGSATLASEPSPARAATGAGSARVARSSGAGSAGVAPSGAARAGHGTTRVRGLRLPAWRSMSPLLRAAAVIMLIAAPVAAVPSLRAWFADTFLTEPAERAASGFAAPAADPGAAVVRFQPEPAYVVEFAAAQQSGALRIARGDRTEAVFQIQGDVGAGPVISAASLQVRNTSASTASYLLELPATVSSLTVRIGGRTVAVLDAAALHAGTQIRLAH